MLPATAAFTSSSTAGLGNVDFGRAFTVLRTMGEYLISPTSAPAAGDNCIVTVGIGVISTDAADVAASAALPDPGEEPEYPWLYWASHNMFFTTNAIQQIIGGGVRMQRFDVKSMRKVKPRETLQVVVEYADVTGAPPVSVHFGGCRVLVAA